MAGLITPARRTHVRFDIDEPVVVEGPFGMHRKGHEIAAGGLGPGNSSNVARLAAGGLTLEPVQQQKHKIHERGDTENAVIRATGWNLVSSIAEAPLHRKHTDLTGLTYDAGVATTGDYFLTEKVQAGQTWGTELTADKTAFPGPTLPSSNIQLKRIAVSSGTPFPVNQGFGVRFIVPGTRQHAQDWLMVIYFGGPIEPLGNGEYALALGGGGMAILYKRFRISTSDPYEWVNVDEFRWSAPDRVCNASHDVIIKPYAGRDGRRFIEFTFSSVDKAASLGTSLVDARKFVPTAIGTNTHLFELWPLKAISPEAPRSEVTGAGTFRIDMNPSVRAKWQVSLVKYAANGYVIDLPFDVVGATLRTNLVIGWQAEIPSGCTVAGKIYDAETEAELTLVSSTSSTRTYEPLHQKYAYFARIELTGDGQKTPILWAYQITKDGFIAIAQPGEFEARTVAPGVSITGAENNPDHETASCTVHDLRDEHSRLKTRGRFTAQIETQYDPNNTALRSVLFRGQAMRPHGRRRGNSKKQGIGGAGSSRVYPASGWRDYAVTFNGVWARLKEARPRVRMEWGQDPTQPAGTPYKVTDIIRRAFNWCGFPDTMLDIPDLPHRLWPDKNNPDLQVMDPLADLQKLIWTLARDYLGGFILWDGNAGTWSGMDGKWRVKLAPQAPYTNLLAFTTAQASAGKQAMRSESYNTGITNWVRSDGTALNVPIVRRDGLPTLETWTEPPEGNIVIVSGTGELLPNKSATLQRVQWLPNLKSCNFLTDNAGVTEETADPDHPDYIGSVVPIFIVDDSLQTEEAVNWMTRRYFDLTCRAVKMASFEAPLPLFVDPTDTLQTKPRPPRYYDPCTIDGTQFLIRNCNPGYSRDHQQFAVFECEAPRGA